MSAVDDLRAPIPAMPSADLAPPVIAESGDPFGALRAIDPTTGERRWELKYPGPGTAGVLTTASGLAFTGDDEGSVLAVESRTGKLLWHYQMGATVHGTSPMTYILDGRQYVVVPAGVTLVAFALPRP